MIESEKTLQNKLKVIIRHWQEKLIDVSKSNPLLGLNRSRAAKLEVESPDLNYLVKTLFTDQGTIKLPFVQKVVKKVQLFLDEDLERNTEVNDGFTFYKGDIDLTYSTLGDLRQKMRKIFDNSRLTLNERGVNTLYLAVGCLEWEDSLMGKSESPLIMIPCDFNYKGSSKALGLIMSDEDIVANPAIKYYLKEREEVDIPEIPDDFDFDKIDGYFELIENQVKGNGWKVSKRAWLGVFNFETLAIYQDLKMLESEAINNKLIQALAHLRNDVTENLSLDNDLDSLQTPQQIPVPVVQADSSQLKAIALSAAGVNLVIHGPPGTGKSQTITGIIADALGKNKKVLFVSAKMAALNVVHTRLQAIGLGDYCLEAHGVKSGKKKVIDELKRSLESNEDIKISKNFEEDLSKLVETRNRLNEYVRSLHDNQNPFGKSVFSIFGKYETLSEFELIKAPIPWSDILEVSTTELDHTIDVLREVSDNYKLFLTQDTHPLRGMIANGVSLINIENLEQKINRILTILGIVNLETNKLKNFLHNIDLPITTLYSSLNLFKSISEISNLPEKWNILTSEELNNTLSEIIDLQTKIKDTLEIKSKFNRFSSKDPNDVTITISSFIKKYDSWYSKLNTQYYKDKKVVSLIVDKLVSFNLEKLSEVLSTSKQLLSFNNDISEKLSKLNLVGKEMDVSILDHLSYLQRQYETVVLLKDWLKTTNLNLINKPEFDTNISNAFASLVDVLNNNEIEIFKIIKELDKYWPNGLFAQIKIEDSNLSEYSKELEVICKNLNSDKVRDWQTISRILNRCQSVSILPFIHKLDDINIIKCANLFEKRFYSLWIDEMIVSNPILSEFSELTHKELINKYKILDEKVMRLSIINTIAQPAQTARQVKTAQTGIGNSNGVGILRKEMEKKKRLKPLRVLFTEIPQVLQALKPCFLMSPLSVSTFLKPGAFNFDLVIFDEASQLPIQEAIPSILRAKQVIVAGDSNQLPPTSFFRSNIDTDSNEWDGDQPEELESLLDDCKAAIPVFKETDLKWHYRSRDERLINFSNHYYYNNKLLTFPAPSINNKNTGVVLEYVPDGIWDRGGSRVNRKEARHVAKLVIEHFKNEPDKTLGVIALNSSQKEAIDDALGEELQTQNNKHLTSLMDPERKDAFFIKSLENVQGDERDVIMISVGYGKAQDGKMSLNFGPINTEGGWRRLNVLVTRAKWKTVLVTSIRSHELIGINPENKGPIGLKNYIQYAENGFLNESKEAPKLLNEETNDFEDSVRRELELLGFKVDAQVGVGSFKIDLAVRDSNSEHGYAIGIECDGALYHSSRSARDRDILRQDILQGMGWKIYRIWSTEWFRNKEQCVRLLIENVTRAINNDVNTKKIPTIIYSKIHQDEDLVSVPNNEESVGAPYVKSSIRFKKEIVIDPKNNFYLSNEIHFIIKDEGPIHLDLLIERIKEITKIGRIGSNIQNNLNTAIKLAIKNGYIEKNKNDKGFLYEIGKKYSSFRCPSDGVERHLKHISAIEISNAIIFIINNQFGLAYDNLIQSIKPLFGISRIDPEESDRLKDIVDGMIASGIIAKQGPLLNLKRE